VRARLVFVLGICALVACGGEPNEDDPHIVVGSAADLGAAMEPLAPSPTSAPAAEPATEANPRGPERRVIREMRRLGRHQFPSARTIEGPWGDADLRGGSTVSALGRQLTECAVTESHTHCPDIGLLARTSRERGWHVEEQLVLLRRGDVTWAASACDVMRLVDADERAATCERTLQTLGAAPAAGFSPPDGRCRWDQRIAGRDAPRDAVVGVRMSAKGDEVEAWAGASPDQTFVDHPRRRTWLARASGWTVGVRIDRRACGEAAGAALAQRLVELAPERR
jgi:hypothetical protein